MEEIQALQNAADSVKLPGLQVHAKIFEDKRKSNKYFLQYGNGLYWRRSGLLPLKLIRSTTVDATTNVHTKHRNRFFANTLLVADADFSTHFQPIGKYFKNRCK